MLVKWLKNYARFFIYLCSSRFYFLLRCLQNFKKINVSSFFFFFHMIFNFLFLSKKSCCKNQVAKYFFLHFAATCSKIKTNSYWFLSLHNIQWRRRVSMADGIFYFILNNFMTWWNSSSSKYVFRHFLY